jgi:spermidine synthase
MTLLVPATKFMAHLPLALHQGKPNSVLIICFGMGTTYRSALSWNIETTAVELIPSVKEAFGFYHADALQVLKNPKGQIVIDDGRRFLNRTREVRRDRDRSASATRSGGVEPAVLGGILLAT